MPSTYTVETLHRLLLHTVAPAFADRRAADQMLFSLSTASGANKNPLDALGEPAKVLHPQIARYLSACERAEEDEAVETDDDAEPEQQFDAAWKTVIDNCSAGLQVPDAVAAELKAHEGLRQDFRDAFSVDEDVVIPTVDVNAFATRMGIDVNEDIPGTRPSDERAAEPDAETRLRNWLAAATGG